MLGTLGTPGAEEGDITRTPGRLAPPGHSTLSNNALLLVTCYPPPNDNLSILTFSGAVKTIQGDHVEIIYICTRQSACSMHYACLSVEVCQSPRLQCDQPRFPAAAPRWPPHPVLAESFTNYISISVSPAVTSRASDEPSPLLGRYPG